MESNIENLVVAVLLNYNQNEYTLKCIESLLASDYQKLKILLIDNGSSRIHVAELKKELPKSKKLIFKSLKDNIGYAQGTNYGLEEGLKLNPKYYLIINNDTIVDKQAITELVKTSKKYKDKARITGKVFHYDKPEILQFIAFKYKNKKRLSFTRIGKDEKDEGQYDNLTNLDMMDDIFVLHPTKLYKLIGGYSKYLWVNGVNIDISLRAIEEGYRLIFCPNAKIWHKGSISMGGRETNPKMAFYNIQSKLILRYINQPFHNFVFFYAKILFNDVLRTQVKSIYGTISGKYNISDYANAKLKAVFYFHKWIFIKNENDGYNPF